MKKDSRDMLLTLVQSYFGAYLRRTCGASEHSVRAYRYALRMFFLFLAEHIGRSVAKLSLDDLQAEVVLAFLQHLESVRGNCINSRNSRLAAIKSFVEHLLRHDITRAQQYGRILAIPTKRVAPGMVTYLEPDEVRSIIGAIDGETALGRRDRALLLLLYNTGARISEALAICPHDLQLHRPYQVHLMGKGGKERICPLWSETVGALRSLPIDFDSDERIFLSIRGTSLTRDGVAYILTKYVRRAEETRPTLHGRRITPHVLRHSCAVALLQAGVDVSVIRDYLGHASIATTSRYLSTNLKMKREVLQAFWKRAGLDRRAAARWRPSPKLLAFLDSL
jgi:site-specific recombinase XerD